MAVRFASAGPHYTNAASAGSQASYTMALWLRIAVDTNAVAAFMSITDNIGGYSVIVVGSDGTSLAYGDEAFDSATTALTVGTWYYVAVSRSGTSGTLYIRALDATSWTTVSIAAAAATRTANSINVGEDSGRTLNANLAGVKVWLGAALTQGELESEMWQYMPSRTANLTAWYPLLIPETVDYSGNGHTLTLTGGSPTTEDGPGIPWRQQVISTVTGTTTVETNVAGPYTDYTPGRIGPTGRLTPAVTDPSIIDVNPETTTGTGVATDAQNAAGVNAETTTGTGVANDAQNAVSVNAETTTGTGVSNAATPDAAVNAGTTTGSGVATDATTAQGANAETTTGIGVASDAQNAASVNAETTTGTGAAANASVDQTANAGAASGTGAANDAVSDLAVNTEATAGTGVAYDATVTFGGTGQSIDAEVAAGTGTAYDASVVTTPQQGSWYGLLAITQEARQMREQEASQPPVACVCGEPLRTGPRGELYCRFDGRRY